MTDLKLDGMLNFTGTLKLVGDGGKVLAAGKPVLVADAEAMAFAPVLLPSPSAPATTSVKVKVVTSFNRDVTAGGEAIVTQGMCMQGDVWPGMIQPSIGNTGPVAVNHIAMNVDGDLATILANGGAAKFDTPGQGP